MTELHSVFEDQVAPSLFEGINARFYRASEVAASFVPNEQFDNLAVRQHSLVVGPRGSGKTTLLRMLHPECLAVWRHPDADRYRSQIDFSGVYVATDRVWREQVASAAEGVKNQDRNRFFDTIVGLDAMSGMVRTLEQRVRPTTRGQAEFRKVDLDNAAVARLVAELAEGWHVEPRFLDLASLRVALRRRRIAARQWAWRKGSSADDPDPPWIGLPWDDALVLAIDAFESASEIRGELWAVLFDEAEIAPSAVRNAVLGSTRGLDPRLLIKCSLSPWLQESPDPFSEHAGTVFNDYNVIRLFYGQRSESYEFSRDLIRTRLIMNGRTPPDGVYVEDALFGRSQFVSDAGGRSGRTAPAYGDGSPLGQVVKDLARIDAKFRSWLDERDIDPDHLDLVTEKVRSETLRKARNIMVARLEFRRSSGSLRSRKTVAMYTGGTTMLDICEGNPRLLLGLLLPLLDYYDGVHPIPVQLQAEALAQISDDFYALIDAIPVSPEIKAPPEFRGRNVVSPYREVVDRVARFFQDAILRGPFNPQPPSTFRVPANVSTELQRIIGRLINIGAIVIIPDRGVRDVVVANFDQHRMRLSYLVAAKQHLPPNVDRPVSIRRVFRPGPPNPPLPGMAQDE